MATDSVVVAGGTRHGAMRKLVRSQFGNLAAGSGDCGAIAQFLEQVEAGQVDTFCLDASDQGFSGLLVTADGTLYRVNQSGATWPIKSGFGAIGTGADIAIGALHMGATAQQAVEAAIAWETSCGGAIQIEHLDNGAIRPAPAKQWDVT